MLVAEVAHESDLEGRRRLLKFWRCSYQVYPEGDVSEASVLSGIFHQLPVHGPELVELICDNTNTYGNYCKIYLGTSFSTQCIENATAITFEAIMFSYINSWHVGVSSSRWESGFVRNEMYWIINYKGNMCYSTTVHIEIVILLPDTLSYRTLQLRCLLTTQLRSSGWRRLIIRKDSTLHVLVSNPAPPLTSHFLTDLLKMWFFSPGGNFEQPLFLSLSVSGPFWMWNFWSK